MACQRARLRYAWFHLRAHSGMTRRCPHLWWRCPLEAHRWVVWQCPHLWCGCLMEACSRTWESPVQWACKPGVVGIFEVLCGEPTQNTPGVDNGTSIAAGRCLSGCRNLIHDRDELTASQTPLSRLTVYGEVFAVVANNVVLAEALLKRGACALEHRVGVIRLPGCARGRLAGTQFLLGHRIPVHAPCCFMQEISEIAFDYLWGLWFATFHGSQEMDDLPVADIYSCKEQAVCNNPLTLNFIANRDKICRHPPWGGSDKGRSILSYHPPPRFLKSRSSVRVTSRTGGWIVYILSSVQTCVAREILFVVWLKLQTATIYLTLTWPEEPCIRICQNLCSGALMTLVQFTCNSVPT